MATPELDAESANDAAIGPPPGLTGVPYFGTRGRVDDELLTQLRGQRWMRIVRQMDENDSTIGAANGYKRRTLRRVPWYFEPGPAEGTTIHGMNAEEVAERFSSAFFHDLGRATWDEVISDALTAEAFGYCLFSVGLKVCRGERADEMESSIHSDGLIMPREFRVLRQETVDEWLWRPDGSVHGLIQVAHPRLMPTPISLARCVHIRMESNRGNPEGRSAYRNIYRAWYFLTRIEELEGTGVERHAVGLPALEMPAAYLDPNTTDTKKAATVARWKVVLQQIRRNNRDGVIIPAGQEGDKITGWKLRLMGIEGSASQLNVREIIRGKQMEIATGLGVGFLFTGKTTAGSKAQMSDETDQAEFAMSAVLDAIGDAFQRWVWKLCKLNGIPREFAPRLTHATVGRKSAVRYADTLVKLAQVGLITGGDELEDYLRAEFELPEREDDGLHDDGMDDEEDSPGFPANDPEEEDEPVDDEEPAAKRRPRVFIPPPAVRAAAMKALAHTGRGGEKLPAAAERRAKALAAGHPITAVAMRRLAVELEAGPRKDTPSWKGKGAAWVRWHAAGGDAGAAWVAQITGKPKAA